MLEKSTAQRFHTDLLMLINAILAALLGKVIKSGTLTLVCADGTHLRFGDGTGAPVRVRFQDARAAWGFVLDPDMQLGVLFTDGRLTLEQGTIFDFLSLLARESGALKPPFFVTWLERTREFLRAAFERVSPESAKKNSTHHYDLDRGIYDVMLDGDKQYSCAYFEREDMSLEEAQQAKKRHIAAKLRLRENHACLDIGSGWGGLALYFARVAGVRFVQGINLAHAHVKESSAKAKAQGLQDKVTFIFQDYRAATGSYDRVVSVGQLEHVGGAHYHAYFAKVAEALKDDGVALIHTIALGAGPDLTNPWLTKYIFPHGYLPALSELLPAIEQAGLLVLDVEVWRHHYAKTLRAWRGRFFAARETIAQIYDERFCRMWEFYLSMAEVGFLHENVVVYQLLLAKRLDALPITRDYIAEEKARLMEKER